MKQDSNVRKFLHAAIVLALLTTQACGLFPPDDSSGDPGSTPLVTPEPLTLGGDPEHPSLQNMPNSPEQEVETGWDVYAGDQIEIRPTCIEHEHRTIPQPSVTRLDHPVCTQWVDVCTLDEPVFSHQCKHACFACMQCDQPNFCRGATCCNDKCTDIPEGRRCVRLERRCAQTQNQWQEETQYGALGPITFEKNMTPMKDPAPLLAGLKLKLVFPGQAIKDPVHPCALAQFKPTVGVDKITATLQDEPGCAAGFATHPGQAAQLTVVNDMSDPLQYLLGIQLKSWDGRVLETPSQQTFLPEIDFAGTIALLLGPSHR